MGLLSRALFGGATILPTWYAASSYTGVQGQKLQAYYGERAYASNYAKGMKATQTGLGIASAYAGLSFLVGGPFTFGALSLLKAGGKSAGRFGGRVGSAAVARGRYKEAMGISSILQGAPKAGRVGGRYEQFTGLAASKKATAKSADRARRVYERAKRHIFRPKKPLSGKKTWFRGSKLDPANWNKVGGKAIFTGWAGVFGAGAATGANAFPRMQNFPVLEAGKVESFRPVFQRMNYSTTGLTQAIHDKRHRTFRP